MKFHLIKALSSIHLIVTTKDLRVVGNHRINFWLSNETLRFYDVSSPEFMKVINPVLVQQI
jgi:hypothetical protein